MHHRVRPSSITYSSRHSYEPPSRMANGSVYMLLSNGCTGSSWVTQTAHALLEAHGVHVLNRGMDTEPETVDGSSVVAKERIHALAGTEHIRGASRAVEWLRNHTLAPSESLFFKAENPKAEHLLPATRIFQSMGVVVHAVSMRRVNALATVVCLVRDCFDTRTGTSVDAVTGRRDTLCFRRRFNTSVRIKARVNVSRLPGALELASQQATVLAALPVDVPFTDGRSRSRAASEGNEVTVVSGGDPAAVPCKGQYMEVAIRADEAVTIDGRGRTVELAITQRQFHERTWNWMWPSVWVPQISGLLHIS